MAKKNPNIFTIGFKKHDPRHQRAVEVLNETDEKAELIAVALLHYLDEGDTTQVANGETGSLRLLIQGMIREEMQKTLRQKPEKDAEIGRQPRSSKTKVDRHPSDQEPSILNEHLRQDITAAMDAFRHT